MFLRKIACAFNALNLPHIFKYYYTDNANANCLILNFCSFFTFVSYSTYVCRKIALRANVICYSKPTLNKISCILYLVSCQSCN